MEFAPAAASQQRGPPLTRLNLAHLPRLCDRGRGTSSPRGSPPWAAGGVGQEGPREMGGRASGGLQRPQHQALRDSAQEAPSSALPGAAAVGEPRPAELKNKLSPLQNLSFRLARVSYASSCTTMVPDTSN